jgi:hypothetical protein
MTNSWHEEDSDSFDMDSNSSNFKNENFNQKEDDL